jgi:formylglycine-generating enzyme required for sulfatase activity
MRLLAIPMAVLAALSTTLVLLAPSADMAEIATVTIPSGRAFTVRRAGPVLTGGTPVMAPLETRVPDAPLVMMRDLVTRADYARCVADSACAPSLTDLSGHLPQTNVSFEDATAFARWLSARTGEIWRLPTETEWARAAAERFPDAAEPLSSDLDDPSRRWLLDYAARAEASAETDETLRAVGGFGTNSNGLSDIAGNVWEWTSTCLETVEIDKAGKARDAAPPYCGVRLVAGPHRAFVIDFVRDASAGGCAAGVPPAHLGFRLVRDPA